MSNPSWLPSQLAYRAATADNLGAAADQMNQCQSIAADLNADGKTHHDNPAWQAAVRESHRLNAAAEGDGIDVHDIGAEAARRRS
jgi:hypothetical protein